MYVCMARHCFLMIVISASKTAQCRLDSDKIIFLMSYIYAVWYIPYPVF